MYIDSVISLSGQKKSRAPKSNKLPDPFPKGEILKDHGKKQWRLGDAIGQGGFGLIYLGKIQLDVKYLNIYCTTDTLIFGSLFALECGLLFSAK